MRKVRGTSAVVVLALTFFSTGHSRGQQLPTSARVETAPLELTGPERFQIPSLLEPLRRVTLVAASDGVLRSLEVQAGATVHEGSVLAGLDRAEAAARLKVAQANVKEAEATLKNASGGGPRAVAEARLEAAQARAEIARLQLERLTLHAPFSGLLLSTSVFPGQYVSKGSTIAELADVSSLRVLVPLERPAAVVDSSAIVLVEGKRITGKIKAVVPLPDDFAPLRALSTALSAAWVVIPNTSGDFEPGQRVLSPALPTAPIATIPARAVHPPRDQQGNRNGAGRPNVQVIRNEYVTDIPVSVLGHPGAERVQVSGSLRPNDALIVSSSVPLLAGTLIRFTGAAGAGVVEARNPDPNASGATADIAPPRPGAGTAKETPSPRSQPRPPATRRPANPKQNGGAVPF